MTWNLSKYQTNDIWWIQRIFRWTIVQCLMHFFKIPTICGDPHIVFPASSWHLYTQHLIIMNKVFDQLSCFSTVEGLPSSNSFISVSGADCTLISLHSILSMPSLHLGGISASSQLWSIISFWLPMYTLCSCYFFTFFVSGFFVSLMSAFQDHVVLPLISLFYQQWIIPCVLPCLFWLFCKYKLLTLHLSLKLFLFVDF